MINETATIVVNCPVEKAFEFISDARNRPIYDSGLIEVRQTPASPIQVGTKIVETRRFLGRKIEQIVEITDLDPNQWYGFRTVTGPIQSEGGFRLEPEGGGTRINFEFKAAPGSFFKLAEPIVARSLKNNMDAALYDIKAALESMP